MANPDQNTSGSDRDKYRDNDDERGQVAADERNSATIDTKSEARGDARENVGNTARGTAADVQATRDQAPHHAQHGNERTRNSDEAPDEFDMDLKHDNERGKEPHGMEELARETRSGMFGAPGAHGDTGHAGVQHARKGQAESPAERTHNEPPKHKQGHH